MRVAMMPMTTSNSTSVKALAERRRVRPMLAPDRRVQPERPGRNEVKAPASYHGGLLQQDHVPGASRARAVTVRHGSRCLDYVEGRMRRILTTQQHPKQRSPTP